MQDDQKTLHGVLIGFRTQPGNGTDGQIDLIMRARDNAGLVRDHVMMPNVDSVTHLVICKIESDAEQPTETVTYSVDATDITSEKTAIATSKSTGTLTLDCLDKTEPLDRIGVVVANFARDFMFDEVRLATTFKDLTIPQEPSKWWILIFLLCLLMTGWMVYIKTK